MKIKLLAVCLTLCLVLACKDILEEQPLSSVSVDQFYKTEKEAKGAVVAIYGATLHNWPHWTEAVWSMDASTDDMKTLGGNWSEFENYTYNATFGPAEWIWNGKYDAISKSNIAIDKLPGVPMPEATKNWNLGETYFLRAFNYFELVKYFGEVPLITKFTYALTDDIYPAKSTTEDVYNFIEADLLKAEQYMANGPINPGDADKGRVGLGVVKGIMARFYLYKGDYAKAAVKAKEVMDLNAYKLNPNYGDNFREATENGVESMLELQYEQDAEQGSWGGQQLAPVNPDPKVFFGLTQGEGTFGPTEDLYNAYEDEDLRKKWSFVKHAKTPADPTIIYFGKFRDEGATSTGNNVSSFNLPILRYAEILLIYAEAAGPTPEGYEALNMVRRRAFGVPLNAPSMHDLSGLTAETFKEAVLNERRLEFPAENVRRFDLIRTGKLVEKVKAENPKANIDEHHIYFPIPQSEIDRNKNLKQNPGY